MSIINRFRRARFLLKGDTYLREKKYEKALCSFDMCESLLKRDYGKVIDEFYDVVIMRAECYLKLHRPEEASSCIADALGMIRRHSSLNENEKRYLNTYIAFLDNEYFKLVTEISGASCQLADDGEGVSSLIRLKFPINFN